jgi:hypothetical protein
MVPLLPGAAEKNTPPPGIISAPFLRAEDVYAGSPLLGLPALFRRKLRVAFLLR